LCGDHGNKKEEKFDFTAEGEGYFTLDEAILSARRLVRQDEQHLEKFRACWAEGAAHLPASNRNRLINLVDELEKASPVDELIRLLVP
jgi:hypothetical protein